MGLATIVIDYPETTAQFESINRFADTIEGTLSLASYLESTVAGVRTATITCRVGAVQAVGLLTVTSSGPLNNETAVVAGVTITAKTSGAVPASGEFNINASATIVATGIALAINSLATLVGVVTATSALGVVTITAVLPALSGNGLILTEAMSNVTATAFAGGSSGATYVLNNA